MLELPADIVIVRPYIGLFALVVTVAAGIFVLRRFGPMRLAGTRRVVACAGLWFMALAIALLSAGVSRAEPVKRRAVLLLIDYSASTGDRAWSAAQDVYTSLRSGLPQGSLLGVAHYGVMVSELVPIALISETPDALPRPTIPDDQRVASNIGTALDYAAIRLPADALPMAVLVTDGQEAASIQSGTIPLAIIPVQPLALSDAAVSGMSAATAANGELTLNVTTFSTEPARARLALDGMASEAIVDVGVERGYTPLTMNARQESGTARASASLAAVHDNVPGNERLSLDVPAPHAAPRVLLVDNSAGRESSKALQAALLTGGFAIEGCDAGGFPLQSAQSGLFDAIVLVDCDAASLGMGAQMALDAFVLGGGGLAMIGGPSAFALGGWMDTPVEKILPVFCRVERDDDNKLGLVIVLDISGSMAAPAGAGIKMDHANRGAELAMRLVMDNDLFGVMATDTANAWVVDFAELRDRATAAQAIRRTATGNGGIYVDTALKEAYSTLRHANVARKQVVLFADSNDADEQGDWERRAATELRDNGISMSTIAIGTEGKDINYLRNIALAGGGRALATEDAETLPLLFAAEAARIGGGYINESAFRVADQVKGELTDGLAFEDAPELLGMVVTRAKEDSVVWLGGGPGGDYPLLATRRYGLGRSLAFTSDSRDRWADNWLGWDGFAPAWQRMARWLATGGGFAGAADADADVRGSRARVTLYHDEAGPGRIVALARAGDRAPRVVEMERQDGSRAVLDAAFGQGLTRLTFWHEPVVGGAVAMGDYWLTMPNTVEARHTKVALAALETLARKSGGAVVSTVSDALALKLPPRAALSATWLPAAVLALAAAFMLAAARRFPAFGRVEDAQPALRSEATLKALSERRREASVRAQDAPVRYDFDARPLPPARPTGVTKTNVEGNNVDAVEALLKAKRQSRDKDTPAGGERP